METKRLRIPDEDRERLKELKDHPLMQELCDEDDPTYEDVLMAIFDEMPHVTLAQPEDDMVFINVEKAYEEVHERAGENESARRVVTHYLDMFEERKDLDL